MEFLGELLPIILYFLLAVLLVVIIVLTCRLVGTIERANILLDDLEQKSQSLNGVFNAIDGVGKTIETANSKLSSVVADLFKKITHKKKKSKRVFEEDEDDE